MATRFNSIRFLISVITIAMLILAIGIAYTGSRKLSHEHAEHDARSKIRNKLNYVQGTAEQLIKADMTDVLSQVISSVSSEPDLLNILIVNQDDIILASNSFSESGRDWRRLETGFDENFIRQVKQSKKTLIKKNPRHDYMEGYVSICTESTSRVLRTGNCGFSVYRINLAYHFAASEQALNLQTAFFTFGISITIAVIFVLMHFWLNRPANRIIDSLSRFNDGDRNERIQARGSNEISLISRAINRVLDTVVEDEIALQNKEERLRAIFDNTIDSVITTDGSGIIQTVNPATESLLGYKQDELVGQSISIITPQSHRDKHDGYIRQYQAAGKYDIIGHARELKAITKQGAEIPIALTVSKMVLSGEKCFTGIIRDITEQLKLREAMSKSNSDLRIYNQALQRKSRTDPLTGIANRGYFDETLGIEIRRAIRQGEPLSLILLDVDFFKPYNDCYGHTQGDKCLQRIASTLSECFQRAGELAARYGGEEFGVIIPGAGEQAACKLADEFRQAIWRIELPHEKSPIADRITVSAGTATLIPVSTSLITEEEVIDSADSSLYQAKLSGRNRVCSRSLNNDDFLPEDSGERIKKSRAR